MRSPEPSTGGMKGSGYYDLHSEYQNRVIERGNELIREGIGAISVPTDATAFTIADYGASTGATSVGAMSTAIRALRERDPRLPVCAVHNDVLTNDFTQLFRNVAGEQGYLDIPGGPIYTTAAAGSFFERVVPDASVHFGMCSNASHWNRQQPHVNVPEGIYLSEATGQARVALAAEGASDWLAFLTARAAELSHGGRLLVQSIGRVESGSGEQVSGARLLYKMALAASSLADEGMLNRDVLDRYVFPVYCRSLDEVQAPLQDGAALADSLDLVSATIDEVANPYWEAYERDGDLDAYVESFMEFIHAWADTTMMTNLFEPGAVGAPAAAVADRFFELLEQEIRSDPEASRYDAWVFRLLVERK